MTAASALADGVIDDVRRILRNDQIGWSDDLIAAGAGSLELVEIAEAVTVRFNKEIEINDIWETRTIAGLVALAKRARHAPPAELPAQRPSEHSRLASPQQQRFYAIHQPQRTDLSEVVSCQIELEGSPGRSEVVAALQRMIRRYDALRMTFAQREEGLRQQDVDEWAVPLDEIDLSDARDDPREKIRAILEEETGRLYDPGTWPLFRCHLLRQPRSALLLFHAYHLIFDGASRILFQRGLRDELRAVGSDGAERVLAFDYASYSDWANWRTTQPFHRRAQEYWASVFDDSFRPTHLAAAKTEQRPDSTAAGYLVKLDPVTSANISALAARFNTTEFTVLLSLFCNHALGLLGDVTVGIPMAGRNHPAVKTLIGLFQNTALVRVQEREGGSLAGLIPIVHSRLIGAQKFQEYQYDRIARDLGLKFEIDRLPITGLYFNRVVENLRMRPGEGNEGIHYEIGGRMKADLMANYQRLGDALVFNFKYRRGAFSRSNAAAFCDRFIRSLVSDVETLR